MMLKRISLAFGIYLAAVTAALATDFPIIPPQATNSFGRDRNTFFVVPNGAPSGRLVAKPITPQALVFLAATTTAAERTALGLSDIVTMQSADFATLAALTTTNTNVTTNTSAISALTTTVSGKQNTLTAGTNITITGSAISAANAPVTSVAGRTGAVTIANTDVSGLGTASTHATGDYAAANHTHAESDVTGLVSDLAGKQATITAGTGLTKTGATLSVNIPADYWRDTTEKAASRQFSGSVLTSGNTATFNVTTDGTSGGTAICTSITAQDTNFTTWGTNQLYNYATPVITNNKVVAVDVKYLSSSNLITGAPVYSSVGNGTRINMKLMCD